MVRTYVCAPTVSRICPQGCDSVAASRDVAQFGSAPHWGCGGHGFKSRRPDKIRDPAGGGVSEPAAPERDRIWTIPNGLSVLRLLGVPLFLYLLLGPHKNAWALVILALSGFTDWLDGVLARKLNQMSSIGALLDPLADRLYI